MKEDAEVSPQNKKLLKYVAGIFGGYPSANRHGDAAGKSFVDVMTAVDSPMKGISSFSTFGLSDHRNAPGPKGRAVPVEIVGACGVGFKGFDKAISTAAFGVINSGAYCTRGAIFPDCVGAYGISRTLSHFFFITPCLWSEELKPWKAGKKKVTWLLAVPISDEERRFAEKEGPAKLDRLLEKGRIDIPDLDRKSVV